MTTNDDEITITNGINNSSRNIVGDNSVIMMFTSSLVQHAASPQLRLPANFVGVQTVRQDFKKSSSSISATPRSKNANDNNVVNGDTVTDRDIVVSHLKASNDVKFCVVDENGNERRMTKAEKKAKKFLMAQAKKEAKKEAAATKKRTLEQMTTVDDDANSNKHNSALHVMADDNEAMEQQQNKNVQSSSKGAAAMYHQLPLDPTTIEQELAEFQGKRGSTPPVILSPPMALQFLSKRRTTLSSSKTLEASIVANTSCDDNGDSSAILVYDHNLSQEWANRLKEQCVLPSEAVREKEDLRPLAYRLQPEPWQRIRPSLEENRVATTSRNYNENAVQKSSQLSLSSSSSATTEKEVPTACDDVTVKPRDWVPLTCRPRMTMTISPLASSPASVSPVTTTTTASIQHDDVLSIVFEYIHRETPFYISCGAKFGSDFLVYDGPRDKRHAFAGLRVLSRFTSSMTTTASESTLAPPPSSPSSQNDKNSNKSVSNDNAVELPLPTAYSLTGFVRCLNTAGKLALLATVDEVSDDNHDNTIEKESSGRNFVVEKKRYRVAFVDVALEKVLDVHKRKNRGRSEKKKLQKRRDVTQTLSKR
jgi:hypothetical protein